MRQIYLFIFCSLLLTACQEPGVEEYGVITTIQGKTQGTTYTIKYIDTLNRNLTLTVDSILQEIDFAVSTYRHNSILSRFNSGDSCTIINEHVLDLFLMSDEVYQITDGAFDPSIKPLVNLWGFGDTPFDTDTFYTHITNEEEREKALLHLRDSLSDELLPNVGWDYVILDGDILYNNIEDLTDLDYKDNYLCKEEKEVKLSFDAIAQGYSADIIGDYLQYQLGIYDFLIEVGGEIIAQGKKPNGQYWNVQIENPNNTKGKGVATVNMKKLRSVAVSGNYRNFKEYDGKKFSHCIDPRTGKPSKSKIVSAAVFANDCGIADAYATAFMVMNIDEAVPFVEGNPFEGIEALFVYYNEDGALETYISSGIEDHILH